jgi:hypothetical protein
MAPQGSYPLAVERSVAKKAKPSTAITPPAVLGTVALGMPTAMGPFAQAFGFAQPATTLESRVIVKAKQKSSEFVLDDGTTLTIRPVLIDAKRATDQWAANGKPVYILTLTNLTDTDSPSKLMDPRFVRLATKNKKRKKRARR